MPLPVPEPSLQLTPGDVAGLADGIRLIARRAFDAPDAVDEIVQETLARTFDALVAGKLRDRDRLGAFVGAIARHVIVDEIRRRTRFESVADDLPDSRPTDDPIAAIERDEESRAVNAAFATLSPADQHIIRLSFVDGLEPTEIARATGEPPERVRKRKSRALERLRDAFHRVRARHAPPPPPTSRHHD